MSEPGFDEWLSLTTAWGTLHNADRHRLRYPSEHVVRFLAAQRRGTALDIGCGWGRHMRLMRELGFETFGVDASVTAALAVPTATCARMDALPYPDETFDVTVAYGVFYYGTRTDGQAAVDEMWRVLKPGGHGFACVRSNHDWRADGIPAGEEEHGMEMHFLGRDDVPRVYGAFADVVVEMTSTSRAGRWDSDWLVSVTK